MRFSLLTPGFGDEFQGISYDARNAVDRSSNLSFGNSAANGFALKVVRQRVDQSFLLLPIEICYLQLNRHWQGFDFGCHTQMTGDEPFKLVCFNALGGGIIAILLGRPVLSLLESSNDKLIEIADAIEKEGILDNLRK